MVDNPLVVRPQFPGGWVSLWGRLPLNSHVFSWIRFRAIQDPKSKEIEEEVLVALVGREMFQAI